MHSPFERGASVLAGVVVVAILGAVLFLFQAAAPSVAYNPRAQMAQTAGATTDQSSTSGGKDQSECTAVSPSGQVDASGNTKKVGKICTPSASGSVTQTRVTDEKAKANCIATDGVTAGKCLLKFCDPQKPSDCSIASYPAPPLDSAAAQLSSNYAVSKANYAWSATNIETGCGAACTNLLGSPAGSSQLNGAYTDERLPSQPIQPDLVNSGRVQYTNSKDEFGNTTFASAPAINPDLSGANSATIQPSQNSQYVLDDYGNPLTDASGNPIKQGDVTGLQNAARDEFAQNVVGQIPSQTTGFSGVTPPLTQNDAGVLLDAMERGTIPSSVQDYAALQNIYNGTGQSALEPAVVDQTGAGWASADFGCGGEPCSAVAQAQNPTYTFDASKGGYVDASGSPCTEDCPSMQALQNRADVLNGKAFGGQPLTDAEQQEYNYDTAALKDGGAPQSDTNTDISGARKIGNVSLSCADGVCTGAPQTQDEKNTLENNGFSCAYDTSAGSTSDFKCTRDESKAVAKTVSTETPVPTARPATAPTKETTSPGSTGPTGANNNSNNPFGGGSGLPSLSSLASLLGALAKFIPGATAQQAQAQTCSTDATTYAQQQSQYQTALQQYNYQLQQYNYQLQQNQYYSQQGYSVATPIAPTQPVPCTASTATQCSYQPSQPAASSCTVGTWQAVMNGSCISYWNCVANSSTSGTGTSTTATTPTATLSCQPPIADVGSTLAIAYSCSSGTAVGSGFTVGAQPAGSATATLSAPPAGTNTATYSLTCTDQGRTAGAQCSVQLNSPSIMLAANPKTVAAGGSSLIGWITTGMNSCVISSADQPDFTARNAYNTSVSGTATTSPVTGSATFTLNCTTAGGATKSASVTVTAAPGNTVLISSSADGATISHGDVVTITWDASTSPSGSAVAFWLVDPRTNYTTALIAGSQPLSGTYAWNVPAASSTCPNDSANICGSDLAIGRQYLIEADVYSPSNAYVGDGARPADAVDPTYGDFADTPAFTVGQ